MGKRKGKCARYQLFKISSALRVKPDYFGAPDAHLQSDKFAVEYSITVIRLLGWILEFKPEVRRTKSKRSIFRSVSCWVRKIASYTHW